MKNTKGFTLIEILVTLVIIAILATLVTVIVVSSRDKARDAVRKGEISQLGKFLTQSCYTPDAGAGSYDLSVFLDDLKAAKPKYKKYFQDRYQDPLNGTEELTGYTYIVTADEKCVLFANLESQNEDITLEKLTEPTPGGGTGVLKGDVQGINGTDIYFQYSN